MNIYLIGYRCTGKSTVSENLSSRIDKEVVHMDDILIKRIGRIDKFVKKNSWKDFRKEEKKLLEELSLQNNLIIDCGGGIIEKEDNISLIKKTGICFWLKAPVSTISQRLSMDKDKEDQRPSLTQTKSRVDEIKEVLDKRIPLYEKASDYQIDTENKSEEDVANEIVNILGEIVK